MKVDLVAYALYLWLKNKFGVYQNIAIVEFEHSILILYDYKIAREHMLEFFRSACLFNLLGLMFDIDGFGLLE